MKSLAEEYLESEGVNKKHASIAEMLGQEVNPETIGIGDVIDDTFDLKYGHDDTNLANERLLMGIKKASGYDDGNMRSEIGKGIHDLVNAGFIGLDSTAADILDFFGADSASRHYKSLADRRKKDAYYPEGAATAVGSELGSMALEAPLFGKAVDLGLAGGGIAKNAYNSAVANRVKAWEKNLAKTMKENDEFMKKTIHADPYKAMKDRGMHGTSQNVSSITPKAPSLIGLTDIIGKVSPTSKKILDEYWIDIIAPLSKNAAIQKIQQTESRLIREGVSPARAKDIVSKMYVESLKVGEELKNAITKPPFGFDGLADKSINTIGKGSGYVGSKLGNVGSKLSKVNRSIDEAIMDKAYKTGSKRFEDAIDNVNINVEFNPETYRRYQNRSKNSNYTDDAFDEFERLPNGIVVRKKGGRPRKSTKASKEKMDDILKFVSEQKKQKPKATYELFSEPKNIEPMRKVNAIDDLFSRKSMLDEIKDDIASKAKPISAYDNLFENANSKSSVVDDIVKTKPRMSVEDIDSYLKNEGTISRDDIKFSDDFSFGLSTDDILKRGTSSDILEIFSNLSPRAKKQAAEKYKKFSDFMKYLRSKPSKNYTKNKYSDNYISKGDYLKYLENQKIEESIKTEIINKVLKQKDGYSHSPEFLKKARGMMDEMIDDKFKYNYKDISEMNRRLKSKGLSDSVIENINEIIENSIKDAKSKGSKYIEFYRDEIPYGFTID